MFGIFARLITNHPFSFAWTMLKTTGTLMLASLVLKGCGWPTGSGDPYALTVLDSYDDEDLIREQSFFQDPIAAPMRRDLREDALAPIDCGLPPMTYGLPPIDCGLPPMTYGPPPMTPFPSSSRRWKNRRRPTSPALYSRAPKNVASHTKNLEGKNAFGTHPNGRPKNAR